MSILGLFSTKLNWTMCNQHSFAVEDHVFDYNSRCHFIDEKPTLSSTLRFKINYMLLICLTLKSHHLHITSSSNAKESATSIIDEPQKKSKAIQLLSLLPLSTNPYGMDDYARCVIRVLITTSIIPADSSSRLLVASYFVILSTQYGTLASIIYFSHSSASRMLWVNLLKRNFSIFYRDREISVPDEQLTNNDNIEDALVIRAIFGGENMALRESLNLVRISERQNSTTIRMSSFS